MEEGLIKHFKRCYLMKGIPERDIRSILDKVTFKISGYSKEQIVAFEGEECLSIGIVLTGSVEIRKIFGSGKTVTVDWLKTGDIFGEVIIFSEMNKYPSTIVSTDNTNIMFIAKADIIKLCSSNTRVLNNFMGLLSNKILVLNKKLKSLSYQTIRQKISSYILDEIKKQKRLTIILPFSRKQMAEQLGIQRPSLSRELIHMKQEGLIDFKKNILTVKDINALEDNLLNSDSY
jgi:CRP-like cAMP-binding protein